MQRTFPGPAQPDGSFVINGVLPGRYVLQMNLNASPWVTLKSVTKAGDDLTDTTITVDNDLDLNVAVTDAVPATVSGRVGRAGVQTDDPSWLRLFPVDRRYWAEPYAAFRRFRTISVAPDGQYSIGSVPAGEYFIVAASQAGSDWMDAATLEVMARTAERIRVNDGDKLVVEVRR